MIVRRFLLWARTAPAAERADAVAALARAYLYADLSPADRGEALTALMSFLDDPSPLVRRALADAVAGAPNAPRALIVALAYEEPPIAVLVLARSPVLTDPDLADSVRHGDDLCRRAVAVRPRVSPHVAAGLAAAADAETSLLLLNNPGADLSAPTLTVLARRWGGDGRLREALLARPDLPMAVRQSLLNTLADSLKAFTTAQGWLSPDRAGRVIDEARQRASIVLLAERPGEADAMLAGLDDHGQLTPAFLLRALLSGGERLVVAAFARLSGLPEKRVEALLADPGVSAFSGLYRLSGMAPFLAPAFAAGFAIMREGSELAAAGMLCPVRVEAVLAACLDVASDSDRRLVALLRRFSAEAAREEARAGAARLADAAALEALMEIAPEMLLLPGEADNDPGEQPGDQWALGPSKAA